MGQKVVNLKALKNFMGRVDKCATRLKDTQKILDKFCQVGTEYARNLYGGTEHIKLEWHIENDVGVIIANGEKIAYLEFGTGERGRGSYEGNLPSEQISFYSSKYQQDIVLPNGWTYSYAKELGLTEKPWSGIEAHAQMWRTAKYLRENSAKIIREVVGE